MIDMHGGGGCASHRARWSGFKALADANKFAVAWPAGYSNQWGTCGSDCEAVKAASGGKSIHDIDDITFIAQLIAFEAARTVGTIDHDGRVRGCVVRAGCVCDVATLERVRHECGEFKRHVDECHVAARRKCSTRSKLRRPHGSVRDR